MTNSDASLGGSVPGIYDSALGPMFFEPYARDLVKRLKVGNGESVLEIAAGTGIVTKHLLERLPSSARLVATDLNEAMLEVGKQNVRDDRRLQWQTADAQSLPFADHSFDAIVCQFGLMFFPDKAGALREMRRVLKPGGRLVLNTWAALRDNPIAQRAHDTIASFFRSDPPPFYTIPFGLHDADAVKRLLGDAGFTDVDVDVVNITGTSASAVLAAKGLVCGTPVIAQINERGGVASGAIVHAVAEQLSHQGGAEPMRLPMRALVFTAE